VAYQVRLTACANSVAKRLHPQIKIAAKASLKNLAQNPYLGKELQAELKGFRSYRFSRYRIIFQVNTMEKAIIVWAIGHRRDIYELFGQHLLENSGKK
jgi:mRNA-degrading endonuclease RelE of RelBE toxin-antitoxin system